MCAGGRYDLIDIRLKKEVSILLGTRKRFDAEGQKLDHGEEEQSDNHSQWLE
jgi:hypothetical protein